MPPLRVAVNPVAAEFAVDAVERGGGTVVTLDDRPDALVWLDPADVDGLAEAVTTPTLRWIQLPFAGVERVMAAGLVDTERTWT